MAGRDGGAKVTVQNIEVLKVISENNLVIVKGSVPGANGSYLIIQM
jgi:large subunit ribosomal protein L3